MDCGIHHIKAHLSMPLIECDRDYLNDRLNGIKTPLSRGEFSLSEWIVCSERLVIDNSHFVQVIG